MHPNGKQQSCVTVLRWIPLQEEENFQVQSQMGPAGWQRLTQGRCSVTVLLHE